MWNIGIRTPRALSNSEYKDVAEAIGIEIHIAKLLVNADGGGSSGRGDVYHISGDVVDGDKLEHNYTKQKTTINTSTRTNTSNTTSNIMSNTTSSDMWNCENNHSNKPCMKFCGQCGCSRMSEWICQNNHTNGSTMKFCGQCGSKKE